MSGYRRGVFHPIETRLRPKGLLVPDFTARALELVPWEAALPRALILAAAPAAGLERFPAAASLLL